MSDRNVERVIWFVVLVVGVVSAASGAADGVRASAVVAEAAYHHPQTGEFTWKECKADE